MSRDEQIRWCALQIAHASTPDRFVKVVNGPVTTIARAQYFEAYLRGEELPEWIDRDEVAVPTDVTGP
jgi:hypothetical protein